MTSHEEFGVTVALAPRVSAGAQLVQRTVVAAAIKQLGVAVTTAGSGGCCFPSAIDWTGTSHTADDAIEPGIYYVTLSQTGMYYTSALTSADGDSGFLVVYRLDAPSNDPQALLLSQTWLPASGLTIAESWVRSGYSNSTWPEPGVQWTWSYWRSADFVEGSVSDFNVLDLPGIYYALGSMANGPGQETYGNLVVAISQGNNGLPNQTQTWTDLYTDDIWARSSNGPGSDWTPWQQIQFVSSSGQNYLSQGVVPNDWDYAQAPGSYVIPAGTTGYHLPPNGAGGGVLVVHNGGVDPGSGNPYIVQISYLCQGGNQTVYRRTMDAASYTWSPWIAG